MIAIVASIAPRDLGELQAAAAVAARDADLIEARAELAGAAFPEWLAALPGLSLPAIVTIRPRAQGGAFGGDEADRMRRLAAAAQVAAWIDVEAGSEAAARPLGRARRIVSWHDFERTPADLEARTRALLAAHPDAIVKVAVAPRDLADVARVAGLQRALADEGARAACFALGALGEPTRRLAGRLGAALVYGSIPGHAPTAPGQLPVQELAKVARVREQRATTAVAAVIGDPVEHSLSPLFHGALCRTDALDRSLVPLRAPELAGALALCDALRIDAAAVTLPHKEAAARAAAGPIEGEPWPPFAGAANTLVRAGAGWLAGNSDRTGFLAALDAGWPAGRGPALRALVLGAGGVARTIVHALRERGVEVAVAGRTRARAEVLAAAAGARAVDWDARGDVERDLVVQATPLGMAPAIDATPLPADSIRATDVVVDTIYLPRRTRLLVEASARGAAVIEGVAMFVEQALAQHRWFTGRAASPEAAARARAMLDVVLEHVPRVQRGRASGDAPAT